MADQTTPTYPPAQPPSPAPAAPASQAAPQPVEPNFKAAPKSEGAADQPEAAATQSAAADQPEAVATQPAAAPKRPQRVWAAALALVCTLGAWLTLMYWAVAPMVLAVAGLVFGFIALRHTRGFWHATVLVCLVAAGVLAAVLAAFWLLLSTL